MKINIKHQPKTGTAKKPPQKQEPSTKGGDLSDAEKRRQLRAMLPQVRAYNKKQQERIEAVMKKVMKAYFRGRLVSFLVDFDPGYQKVAEELALELIPEVQS